MKSIFQKKNSDWLGLIQKLFLGHDAENKNIGWKVDYGPESVEGATEVNVNNAAGTDYALVCYIFLNQYIFYVNAYCDKRKIIFLSKKNPYIYFFYYRRTTRQ